MNQKTRETVNQLSISTNDGGDRVFPNCGVLVSFLQESSTSITAMLVMAAEASDTAEEWCMNDSLRAINNLAYQMQQAAELLAKCNVSMRAEP